MVPAPVSCPSAVAAGPLAVVPAAAGPIPNGWEGLYAEHADFVWRSLRRMGLREQDAEDALHDAFLIAQRRLHTFDGTRGSARSWLFGIAVNVVRAERRKRRPIAQENVDEAPSADTAGPTVTGAASERASDGSAALAQSGLGAAILRALGKLEPDHRAVFTMFEIEGLGCAEIAAELDIPVGTVYSRLHTARGSLQRALDAHRLSPPQVGP